MDGRAFVIGGSWRSLLFPGARRRGVGARGAFPIVHERGELAAAGAALARVQVILDTPDVVRGIAVAAMHKRPGCHGFLADVTSVLHGICQPFSIRILRGKNGFKKGVVPFP